MEISDIELEARLWGYLRPRVLEALPEGALNLLKDIEEFANLTVGFRDMDLLRKAGASPETTDAEALFCDHERAYISIPDPTNINPNAVVHELLHLQRYWVEGVPQIEPTHDIGQNVEFLTSIDNTLEHIVIVPRERLFGYDPSSFWAQSIRDVFADYPWHAHHPDWIRCSCILIWLTCSLTEHQETIEDVRSKISQLGLFAEVEQSTRRIIAQVGSKPRMTRAALKALKIPLKSAQLVTLDARNRTSHRRAIPAA